MINIDDMITEIVGDNYEFWKQGGRTTLYNALAELLDAGVVPEVAMWIVSSVWHASADEYGA